MINFTDQQKEIISYEGNSFILAAAGSAKTTTIIEKIRKIKQEHRHSRVLYVTFTRKSKSHAIEKIGRRDDVLVSNFHGLAYAILCGHKKELRVSEIDIVPESYAINVMYSLFPEDTAKDIRNKMNLVNMLYLENKSISEMTPQHKSLFIQIRNILESNKKFLFDTMVYKVNELFDNGLICNYIAQTLLKFDYIFIDETQDVNLGQVMFINNLMKINPNAKIMAVADTSQSIFSYRWAKPDCCLSLIDKYSMKIFPLTVNFRSQQSVIDFGNSILNSMVEFKELRKPMNYFNPRGENIHWYQYNNPEEQYQSVCDIIKELVNKGYNYSDFYVLFRMNLSGTMFEKMAIKNRIPFRLLKGNFLERKEIKYFINMLKFSNECCRETVVDGQIIDYLKEFAEELAPDIGKVSFKLLSEYDNSMGILDKLKVIKSLNIKGIGKTRIISFDMFYRAIDKMINIYKKYLEDNDIEKIMEKYKDILFGFKYIKKMDTLSFDSVKESMEDLFILLNSSEGNLLERLNSIMIDYTIDDKDAENVNKVLGMTVHKAKGTENKVCIIIDFNKFPPFPQEYKDEEVRIVYVAVTRAMERLYITSCEAILPLYLEIFSRFPYLTANKTKEEMKRTITGDNYIEKFYHTKKRERVWGY